VFVTPFVIDEGQQPSPEASQEMARPMERLKEVQEKYGGHTIIHQYGTGRDMYLISAIGRCFMELGSTATFGVGNLCWLGSYMSGGVGFTQYATAAYTDNILDEDTYYGMDLIKSKYKVDWKNPTPKDKVKPTQAVVNDIATEVALNAIENYEAFPTALAVAEKVGNVGGKEFVTAMALGVPLAGFIFDATGSYNWLFILVIIFYAIAIATIYFTSVPKT
jgi:hypothetical protein